MTSNRRGPAASRWLLIAVGGYLYGFLTAHIPAPDEASVFWAGNLAAPYLLLPFLAGAWRFGPWAASAAGALASGTAIAGFYGFLMVGDVTNDALELPPTTTARSVVIEAYERWFSTFLLGDPGGIPWLSIAILVGLVCGHLGYRWRQHGNRLAAAVVALAFVVEPLLYAVRPTSRLGLGRYDLSSPNLTIWGVEAVLGLAGLVWVMRAGKRRSRRG